MNTSSRRSGARTRSSRLAGPFVVLALAAGLAACGSDGDGAGDGEATDPAGATSTSSPETPTDTPSETPPESPSESATDGPTTIPAIGSAGITEAVLVSATEGGGTPSEMAFALDTDRAVQEFVTGMQNGLPQDVTAAVADVAGRSADATPYGAVVSTGCDAPRGVAIEAGEAGFQVVPRMPKNTVQCVAPVTYVVVFAAPNA